MTACKDSLSGKKAVSATLAGVLAVGMVPAAAFAETAQADTTDEAGISLQVYDKAADFAAGTVLGATGEEGVAYDDPANIEISLSKTPVINLTKVKTKEDGVIVDLLPTNQDSKIVKANKKGELPEGTTYDEAETVTPDKAGTYYAIFKVKGLTGDNAVYNNAEIALKFTVTSTSLSEAEAYEMNADDENDLSDTTFTYNGAAQKANIGFKIGDEKLTTDDYTVEYYVKGTGTKATDNVTAAGDYTAILTGQGDYANSKASIDFTVEKLDLSKATIVVKNQNADLLTADLKQINNLKKDDEKTGAAFAAVNGQLAIKFVSGPEGSVVANAKTNGTYKYTVTANKESDDTDNKNITGTATVSYDKTAGKDVTWTYDNGTITDGATYAVDHSLSSDDAGYKADFDPAKLVAKPAKTDADYKTLATTYVVKDKDGNEVGADKLSTPGTWTVVFTIDAKANEYNYGGTFTQTVTVTEGEINGNAAVIVKKDGKVTSAPAFTYDGTDALKKLDLSVTIGGKSADYTLEVKKGDKKVDEAVNAGSYTVTVKVAGYTFKDDSNVFTLTVNKVDMTHVRVAGESTLYTSDGKTVDYTFTPYTGEAIDPTFEYQTNYAECQKDSSIEPVYAPIPAELYTVAYGYNKDLKATASSTFTGVTEVKEVGTYKATFTKVSAADKDGNYTLPTTACFKVSDHKFFYDVQAIDWFYTPVNQATNLGYMNGYGKTKFFGPSDAISRGQVACVLFNMAGGTLGAADFEYDNNGGYASFSDVDGGQYYAKAVAWAKAAGVVNGYDDGTFRPENSITREEFAAMLANYAKKVGNFEVSDGSALAALPDADQVSGWAKESVAWAVENGIMGNGGVVNPAAKITRAEAAAMAVNYQPEKFA